MRSFILRLCSLAAAAALLIALSVAALSGKADDLSPSILSNEALSVKSAEKKTLIILDAGHGGEDGGAVGTAGTLEKDLNLALALRVKDLLTACGCDVLLTRAEDVMTGDGEKGHKKLADLQYRLKVANEHPDALLISIHMNKFPLSYCKGIQLYYSGNDPESEHLAKEFHRLTKELQPDNRREPKKATSAIYLLDRATLPAVLIECGFLSNPEEEALLKTEEYQKKLALLILASVDAYRQNAPDRTENGDPDG